ncbi:hypothetical protein TRFO_39304 [Tritrichomonas foetus]|uniref:Peptidase A1 domain-containing protein n=1 Tax=Tritrichomonas foetus TaxID=1144522 RepID=A0A1J4J5L4_9EUKA|nr:hypothetical protein TRFO_39304 [Tritrichomonas foetus]|eukprot:OHS94534.1 hypothetical protein TRFO_39304 [Tritrichomonas foetus]
MMIFFSLLLHLNACVCDETIWIEWDLHNPYVFFQDRIPKSKIICINTSKANLAVIFNDWSGLIATSYRINDQKSVENSQKTNHKTIFQNSLKTSEKDEKKDEFKNYKIKTDFTPNFTENNHERNSEINIFQKGEKNVIKDGPYIESKSKIMGFYFGTSIGSVEIKSQDYQKYYHNKKNLNDSQNKVELLSDDDDFYSLSFGAVLFSDKTALKIISNFNEDHFVLNRETVLNLNMTSKEHVIQYFNGNSEAIQYDINMKIDEEKDFINFRSFNSSTNFTGNAFIQKIGDIEQPQLLTWFVSNQSQMEHLLIELKTESNSKSYGRLWTNNDHYKVIPAFKYSKITIAEIVVAVVAIVVLIVITVGIINLVVYIRKKNINNHRIKENNSDSNGNVTNMNVTINDNCYECDKVKKIEELSAENKIVGDSERIL